MMRVFVVEGRLVVNDQVIVASGRARFLQTGAQAFTGGIVSDYADYASSGAERDHVGKHIRRAAQMHRLAPNVDDRHRRFGRDTRDLAPDKFIEHHVAEHDDLAIAHRVDQSQPARCCVNWGMT